MFKPKHKTVNILLVLAIILSASISFSQYEPQSQQVPKREEEAPPPADHSILQQIPPGYWIKFNAFSTFSVIIVILAFVLGFVSYFIGMNAGGRVNKREIRRSILSALVIAIVARPIAITAHKYAGLGLSYILPDSFAYGIAEFIVYILWMMYIIAIPVYLYESFTVSAKEAYPVGDRR